MTGPRLPRCLGGAVAGAAGAAALVVAVPAVSQAQGLRWRGRIEAESRAFPRAPLLAEQARHDGSAALGGELSLSWGGGAHLITVEPFFRLDAVDRRRTHADLRVLSYERAWRHVELRVGVRRVFWGVTESRHLVDIINQTDLVENPDGEDKLGQPMVNLAWLGPLGTVDLYLLAGFRQRTFPGADGRLRSPIVVESDRGSFASDGVTRRLGWAARWFRSVGEWDIGASHFHALSREPRIEPGQLGDGTTVLVPHYDRVHQTGVDAQWTTGAWLWKFEGMTRSGEPDGRRWAMVAGFEYTLYQLFGSAGDLGLLTEALLDTRDQEPFQDDVFVGGRLVLNDVRSTEVLAGAIVDRSTGASVLSVEAGRRIGEAWSLDVEARGFLGMDAGDPLYGLRRDGYALLRLTRWF